jgi:DNA-directed RNA polymerase specialized sigma24 family protein
MGNRPTVDGRHIVSAGFARLLSRLHPDPDRAAAEYERLRVALEKFFDWHCAWPPEECADETLDRLALKLATEGQIDDVRAYARGIARRVLLEWRRKPAPVSIAEHPEHSPSSLSTSQDDEAQTLSVCFERCLGALPDESRTLVLDYYVAEGRAKIDNRRRLARALGLSESALRNRVQRVRNRLERCVQSCTAEAATVGLEAVLKQPIQAGPFNEK